jgi:hypothetical protein
MNDDVRELLRRGVGEVHDLPDTDHFWRLGRRRAWWRRGIGTTTVVVLAVVMLALVGQAWQRGPAREVQPADVLPTGQEPTPLRIGQLEPGTYAAEEWNPPFVLALSDDTWRVVELDRDWLSLVRGPDVLQIARWQSVVDPSARAWGSDVLVDPPADLAAWLTGHPRLRTTSEATSLAGVPAVRITARTLGTLDSGPPDCAGQPCVPLARAGSSGAFLSVAAGQVATFYVVGDAGNQFVMFYAAPRDRFAALEAASEELLESLRFGMD